MQSRQSRFNPTTISKPSIPPRPLLLLMAILLCSFLQACQSARPCPVCPNSQISLPVEQAPALREIQATKRGSEYCLDDRARKNLLIDIEVMRAWCSANQAIIEEFNKRGMQGK